MGLGSVGVEIGVGVESLRLGFELGLTLELGLCWIGFGLAVGDGD